MAVDRADVAVIVIDATVGFTEQDSKVAGYAHEKGKACVVAVNKWDAIEKETNTMNDFQKKLQDDFSFMSYVPFVFISAKQVLEWTSFLILSSSLQSRTLLEYRQADLTMFLHMLPKGYSHRLTRVEG